MVEVGLTEVTIPICDVLALHGILERVQAGESVESYADEARVILDSLHRQLVQQIDLNEQEAL